MTRVRIPPVLRETVGGARELRVEGATVAEALEHLFTSQPALGQRLTEHGSLSRFVNVYVGDQDIRHRQGLATPVAEDDVVLLLPAMAGGTDPR